MGRKLGSEFKAKVAIEAIKGEMTTAQISSKYEVHRSLINTWRKQALTGILNGFTEKHDKAGDDNEKLINELYRQIGQLKVENEWLKKKSLLFER